MKTKYHISQATYLALPVIIEKILTSLKEKNYGIISIADSKVLFNDHSGGLVWNFQYFDRLESGKFEITTSEKNYNVNFEYCPLALSELIGVPAVSTIFAIVVVIASGTYFGFIALIFILRMVLKFYNLKSIAKAMLIEIAG